MTTLTKKPVPPGENQCCESGLCNPCVWDYYYAELKKWRIEQAKLKDKIKDKR